MAAPPPVRPPVAALPRAVRLPGFRAGAVPVDADRVAGAADLVVPRASEPSAGSSDICELPSAVLGRSDRGDGLSALLREQRDRRHLHGDPVAAHRGARRLRLLALQVRRQERDHVRDPAAEHLPARQLPHPALHPAAEPRSARHLFCADRGLSHLQPAAEHLDPEELLRRHSARHGDVRAARWRERVPRLLRNRYSARAARHRRHRDLHLHSRVGRIPLRADDDLVRRHADACRSVCSRISRKGSRTGAG